jgi:hypothetical protein
MLVWVRFRMSRCFRIDAYDHFIRMNSFLVFLTAEDGGFLDKIKRYQK